MTVPHFLTLMLSPIIYGRGIFNQRHQENMRSTVYPSKYLAVPCPMPLVTQNALENCCRCDGKTTDGWMLPVSVTTAIQLLCLVPRQRYCRSVACAPWLNLGQRDLDVL